MRIQDLTSNTWDFIVDHAEKLPQGIHLHYKGVPYPRRVYHDSKNDPNFFLRALDALGRVKKLLFTLTFLKDLVIPRSFSAKKWEKFLVYLFLWIDWNLAEFWIKDEEYSVPVWEIGKIVHRFLWGIGFSMEISAKYARVIMMILEFDNAYRYRVQDIFGIMDKQWLLNNPRKELKRAFDIYIPRETIWTHPTSGAQGKLRKVLLLRGLLFFPKVKAAFSEAITIADFEKIRFDINDRYHTSWWRGYDYEGKDFDTRYQFFLDTHKGDFPPFHRRERPEVTANFMTGK